MLKAVFIRKTASEFYQPHVIILFGVSKSPTFGSLMWVIISLSSVMVGLISSAGPEDVTRRGHTLETPHSKPLLIVWSHPHVRVYTEHSRLHSVPSFESSYSYLNEKLNTIAGVYCSSACYMSFPVILPLHHLDHKCSLSASKFMRKSNEVKGVEHDILQHGGLA